LGHLCYRRGPQGKFLKRALNTPRGLARLEFAYRGLKIPYGSAEESFALLAHDREQQLRFYSLVAVVSAIISTGNRMVQAFGNQPGEDKAGKQLSEVLKSVRELLLPEDSFAEEKRMAKVLQTLEKEVAKGPIRVRPQSGKKRKRLSKKK
jgi:hypothetical protein